ncbi:hypothetical protein F4804DRAFT_335586 [Jackrogersella minutella]|nr:hypothetical protein F4804DRAFT_335586 [Jackrogersella minutella]
MLVIPFLVLAWCGLFVFAQEKYVRVSVTQQRKREAASCEQTYGNGSQSCGGVGSTFCFNPSSGQSCCAADNGFCDSGKYCAPVAGYCCLEGEDLATCAQNAGFALPDSASNTTSTGAAAVADVTTISSPTITVIPFLKETSVPTSVDIQDDPCSPDVETEAGAFPKPEANSTTSVPTVVSHTNATAPPLVQVSFTERRVGTSAGLMVIVGIVGILTTFF